MIFIMIILNMIVVIMVKIMSKEYDKDKLLKNKKKGDLLKPNLPEGEIIKSKKLKGRPLWIDDELNEEKKKKKKLNE